MFEGENRCKPEWARPIVYARRRLIELGHLVKYNNQWISPKYKEILIKKQQLADKIAQCENGHHFENKKRVNLTIKVIDRIFFEGYYGMTYILTMASQCGKLFKYMGGNPPQIQDEYVEVKATIKHDNYKDQDETKLQRISILK